MTNDPSRGRARSVLPPIPAIVAAIGVMVVSSLAVAAEPYPFEGTWIRANRVCNANAPRTRTYTSREVSSPGARCAIRKIASGSGQFEIFASCRRSDRAGAVTDIIRMLGPDTMQVRRQMARLKIARALRYVRCNPAAQGSAKPPPSPAPKPAAAPGREERGAPEIDP